MKRYILGGVIIIAVAAYIFYLNFENKDQTPVTPPDSSTPQGDVSNPNTIVMGMTVYPVAMLNVRQGPSTSTALIGTESTEASGLVLQGSSTPSGTAWFEISYANGIKGWSDADYLSTTSSTPSSPSGSNGQYKDGTYTGSAADAFYGTIQAQAVVQGGKIVDVKFLQYPQGGNSSNVSNMALPILRQEAIATQSASVDIVSGATQDSQAFQESFGAALSQAKN